MMIDEEEEEMNCETVMRIRVEIKFIRKDSSFRYRRMYDENVRRRIGIGLKRDVFAKEKDVEFIFLRNPIWNREVSIVATGVLMMTTSKSRNQIERSLEDSEMALNLRLRDTAHEIELIEVFDSFRRFETGLRVIRVSPSAVDVRWRDKHVENDSYTLRTYAAAGDLRFESNKIKHLDTKKYLLVHGDGLVKLTKNRSHATNFQISSCESRDGTGRLGVFASEGNKRLCVSKGRLRVSSSDKDSLTFHGYKSKGRSIRIWQETSKEQFACSRAYRADTELGDSDSEDRDEHVETYHQLSVRVQDLDPSTSYFFVLDRGTSLDFPQQSEIVGAYQHEDLRRAVCESDVVLTSLLCFEERERKRRRESALLVRIEPEGTIGLAPCRLHPGQKVQTVQNGEWIDAIVFKRCVDADRPDQFYDLSVTERGSSRSVVLSYVSRYRIRVSETSARHRLVSICGVPYVAIRSRGHDVEVLYESELAARTLNLGAAALPFRTPCGGEIVLSSLTENEVDLDALEDARSIGGFTQFVLERRDAMCEFASKIGTHVNGFVPPLRFESRRDEALRLEIRYLYARDGAKVERLMDMFVSPYEDVLGERRVSTIFTREVCSTADCKIPVSSRSCTEKEWHDFLETCRLRSRLEGSECVPTWRGSPRIYLDVIRNDVVISSVDACQIQSVYNAERDYLKSIDCMEDRFRCVRADLTMIVADPSWSLYRIMFCPSMKDEGEFGGQYVIQQVRRTSRSWTWLHHREMFMRAMALENSTLRTFVSNVVFKFCRHHRREVYYAMQFGNHEHSKRVQNMYCGVHPLLMCDVAGLNALHYVAFEGDSEGMFAMLEQIGSQLSKNLTEELLAIVLEMRERVLEGGVFHRDDAKTPVSDEPLSWTEKMEARWISPFVRCTNSEVRLRRGSLFRYDALITFFENI